jgi:hypothetical protein
MTTIFMVCLSLDVREGVSQDVAASDRVAVFIN